MKLRYKIATGFVALLAIAVTVLAVVLSHNGPCTPPPAPAPGAETMQAVSYTCYGGPEVLTVAAVFGGQFGAFAEYLTLSGDWLGPVARPLRAMLINPFVGQELVMLMAQQSTEDLEALASLAESGQLRMTIDRRYSLAEIADAIRYSETGRARGKIIIEVGD